MTSPLENVEIARRAYAAFNRGDLEGMVADFAPEFEYVPTGVLPGTLPHSYRGPEGWKEYVSLLESEFYDSQVEVRELVEAGDRVLASLTLRGRGKQSGLEASMDLWQLWSIRSGKLVHGRGFTDRAGALEAAGLSE